MAINRFTNEVIDIQRGETDIIKVYLGETLIWQKSTVDPDAEAFFTATGITDPTQQGAVNTLVIDLKNAGLWNKMVVIYPFVGGTATTHKYNLKDPQDTNEAYRLTFNAGTTHNENGVVPNGTAETYLNATTLTTNDTHMSIYNRVNDATEAEDIAAQAGDRMLYHLKFSDGNHYSDCYNAIAGQGRIVVGGDVNIAAFFIQSRIANNSHKTYRNGVVIGTSTGTSGGSLPNANFQLFRISTRPCSFVSIGSGLTDQQAEDFYNIVQDYQTALGREL
jgi:hypothetical protein